MLWTRLCHLLASCPLAASVLFWVKAKWGLPGPLAADSWGAGDLVSSHSVVIDLPRALPASWRDVTCDVQGGGGWGRWEPALMNM